MKFAWATDIHLNFVADEDVRKFRREISHQNPAALLLAGDIGEANSFERYMMLLGGTLGIPVHFVLGNHDFYGGRIGSVREKARGLARKDPTKFCWLQGAGVIKLTPKTGLVGVDGWGDGRIGNHGSSPVELADWKQIEDFKFLDRGTRLNRLRMLGSEAGDLLRETLPKALDQYENVIILTHVPPFKAACWHEGQISDDNWLPWFTCHAAGDALLAMCERYPHRKMTVLCGHTHGRGMAKIRDNLTVMTGGAEYGKPAVQPLLDLA